MNDKKQTTPLTFTLFKPKTKADIDLKDINTQKSPQPSFPKPDEKGQK